MRRALLGMLLSVACEQAPERVGEPPKLESADDKRWRVQISRERAKAVLWTNASKLALVESKRLEAIDADLQRALDERGAALTMAARRAADEKLEAIRTRLDVAFKAAASIQSTARDNERRLDALPERCFDDPPPTDCKL